MRAFLRAIVVVTLVAAQTGTAGAQVRQWYVPVNPYYRAGFAYLGYPYSYYYGYPFATTPAEAYMRGLSNVIRARSMAARNFSQTRLNYEQARSRYLENRRKWLQIYYARKRETMAQRAERRAEEREQRERYLAERTSPWPTLTSDQVDFATGQITWPEALLDERYADYRRRLEEDFVLLAHTGNPASLADEIYLTARKMQAELKKHIREIRPYRYIEARRFLDAVAYTLKSDEARQRIREAVQADGPRAAPTDIDLLVGALDSPDLAERHEAILALGRMGPDAYDAVPALVEQLDHETTIIRHAAANALGLIGRTAEPGTEALKQTLRDDDPVVGVAAARALVRIRPDDEAIREAALPVLVDGLKSNDPHMRMEAIDGLAAIGAPAVAKVSRLVGADDPPTCRAACEALARMGRAAEGAVSSLLVALKHDDADVRRHAAEALGAVGAWPERTVSALAEALRDDSPSVRAHAAYALGRFGVAAESAVPALAEVLRDPALQVRLAAVRALGELGSYAAAAVPALAAALRDEAGAVTLAAADALVQIGRPAVPALAEKLEDRELAPLAATALGRIGPAAQEAVPALTKLLDSGNEETRREAILALAEIGPKAESAVPALMGLLKKEGDPLRAGGAYALAMIGAERAIPVLEQTVRAEDDELLRMASAWALVHFEPDNPAYVKTAVPKLTQALTHERPLVRVKAAEALAQIGPEAAPAVPALKQALEDEDPEVRIAALDALAAVGPDAGDAVASVIPLLEADDATVRAAAANALGRIGRSADKAVPALRRMFERGGDSFERTVAAASLIRIEPRPEFVRSAVPLLVTALHNPRPEVRAEAATVLGQAPLDDPSVVNALDDATTDEDESVREAAKEGLNRLVR